MMPSLSRVVRIVICNKRNLNCENFNLLRFGFRILGVSAWRVYLHEDQEGNRNFSQTLRHLIHWYHLVSTGLGNVSRVLRPV